MTSCQFSSTEFATFRLGDSDHSVEEDEIVPVRVSRPSFALAAKQPNIISSVIQHILADVPSVDAAYPGHTAVNIRDEGTKRTRFSS